MKQQLPFRQHHLFLLLEGYSEQNLPLDLYISHYFRNHKALGSKDRAFIAETVYALVRWQELLDYLAQEPHTWQQRYEIFLKLDFNEIVKKADIPPYIRVSCPKVLFDLLSTAYGEQKAIELSLENNSPAPTTIRVNTLKISREELFNKWKEIYDISLTQNSSVGITFHKKINFFELPEFKAGFFEVQDEGSQLLANLVQVQPGQQLIDFCAGSGGKTLAIAPKMEGQGQIYLHDIRSFALQEAKKRLRRAGIQNAQIILPDSPHLEKIKKKMDWVLVDAPCTGTGTFRRNPDMKWRFNDETLPRLIGQQRIIFEKALSFLKPSGSIVYGTCSILPDENEKQIEHFVKTYNLKVDGHPFQSFPTKGNMDGFFGVVLKKL